MLPGHHRPRPIFLKKYCSPWLPVVLQVIDYYQKTGRVAKITADRPKEEVSAQIRAAMS